MAKRLAKEVEAKVRSALERDSCLVCGKLRDPDSSAEFTRQACSACYQSARRKIQRGETTDRALVAAGLFTNKKMGRPPSNPAAVAISNGL